ncbi:sulfur carrier protein ThiS [Desulfovibrio ferrophilus]|uniref:Thiamine biosynthesis protein ThiS n=1 Tax=Desulfovibrio ferrophilus TaxID=241368 RepID=A0A2Z6AY47_9BACT|nr:sulfur carrier protein ThiS [Desulfovibrio ferrophilus]BBD08192.1 thiamine biosynthesis protein ThiS [Desulfovibrio ferrophilus]
MTVTINGQETTLPPLTTVLALLRNKELDPASVVVERNGDIIQGDAFGTTELVDGDRLEILRFVGGG